MVSIGGLNVNLIPSSGVVGSIIKNVFWGLMILIAVSLIGWWIWASIRKKAVYTNKATLTYYYDNGTQRTVYGLMGGRYVNRSGVNDFRIKVPKQRAKKELGYMPDFSLADSDGTLHFTTSGDGSIWVQTQWILTENGNIQKPVATDIKTVTVNNIKSWSEMVNKNKLTVYTIAIGAFIIMVIAHLISLYIQTKVKCGIPATP